MGEAQDSPGARAIARAAFGAQLDLVSVSPMGLRVWEAPDGTQRLHAQRISFRGKRELDEPEWAGLIQALALASGAGFAQRLPASFEGDFERARPLSWSKRPGDPLSSAALGNAVAALAQAREVAASLGPVSSSEQRPKGL